MKGKLLADGRGLSEEIADALWAGSESGVFRLHLDTANRMYFRLCALETALEGTLRILDSKVTLKDDEINGYRQILRGEP